MPPGSKVLYLGAASGTSVSHVSDIVGPEGMVYAVEFSHRSGRDLLNVAKKRTNVVPIIEDARHPHKYRMLGSVVGLDVAGVVESVGSNVTSLNVGDEVFGGVKGSLAEFAVGKPESLGKKAKCLSFVEAAAMPIAYMTSLQSLRDAGKLEPGSRVLIIGASGGCGLAAVQLAKAMDAGYISGVCSGKNEAIVMENGATEVVDYTQGDVVEHYTKQEVVVEKFDIVYDSASNSGGGEDYREKSLSLLKQDGSKHGQYVAINGAASMWARNFTIGQKKNEHLVVTNMNTKDLEVLSTMAEEGKLKPVIL